MAGIVNSLVLYPIPPNFIDFGLRTLPLMIGLFATFMRVTDYFLSGTLLRSAGLASLHESFDFIVVGAGTTGSVVASRLSEKFRVLLIEAGGNPNPYSYLPLTVGNSLRHPDLDWDYKTVPQSGCAYGLTNQEILIPRGKSVGGSSNLNFMIYMKGNRQDFDRWAAVTGNKQWSYENVEHYFHKVEDYNGVWDRNGYHGKGGPIRIEGVKYRPGLNYILDAAKEAGFSIRDLNKDQQPGFSPLDFTQKRGLRFNVYRGYIKPSLKRNSNLVIYKYTQATKIHFDENHRAIGVSYVRHGVKGYAEARKEIIISAGAINSPQLLMLSGIGPKQHLNQHKIPPIVDLPGVGENFQDHVTTIMGPFLLNDSESFMLHRDLDVGAIFSLAENGTGPMTSPLGSTAVGLASTSFAPSPNWPDIMFTVASQGVFPGLAELIDDKFNFGNTLKVILKDIENDAHSVLVTLGLPKSRGYIRLKNSNPFSYPIINPRFYSDLGNQDLNAMKEGLDMIVKIYENTTSFKRLNAKLLDKRLPGCEQYTWKTPDYYECFLKTATFTLYHPCGSCKMGRVEDPDTVVDSELRVIGVTGLRVADASIMPFITNANTNAPCVMIGEVASDMIKRTWGV